MKEPTPRQGIIRFLAVAIVIFAIWYVANRSHGQERGERIDQISEDSIDTVSVHDPAAPRSSLERAEFKLMGVQRENDSVVIAKFETDLPDGFQVNVSVYEIFQGLEEWGDAEVRSGIANCSLSLKDGKWMYRARPFLLDAQSNELQRRFLISSHLNDTVWRGRFKLGSDASISQAHARTADKRAKWLGAVRELKSLIATGRSLDRIFDESSPRVPDEASLDEKIAGIYVTAYGPYGSKIRKTIARWQQFHSQLQSDFYDGLSSEFTDAATRCLQCIQIRKSGWCDSVDARLRESPEWRLSQPRNE